MIVGAGEVRLEMAEGRTARGIKVVQVKTVPEVLPTDDPELRALVRAELPARRRRRYVHGRNSDRCGEDWWSAPCTRRLHLLQLWV